MVFDEIKPLPLVLVKQPNEHGALKISDLPVSYSQLQATILKRFPEGAEFGKDFFVVSTKERIFRLVNYTSDHTMTEYVVAPQAQNNSSWHEVKTLSPGYVADRSYIPGTVITSKNVESYIIDRFFTDGKNPEMLFYINNLKSNENLNIILLACQNGLLETDFKKVDLYVNDIFVTTWEIDKITKIYTAIIPHELLNDRKLKLSFRINDAEKFFYYGKYLYDTLLFYKLVIDYDK